MPQTHKRPESEFRANSCVPNSIDAAVVSAPVSCCPFPALPSVPTPCRVLNHAAQIQASQSQAPLEHSSHTEPTLQQPFSSLLWPMFAAAVAYCLCVAITLHRSMWNHDGEGVRAAKPAEGDTMDTILQGTICISSWLVLLTQSSTLWKTLWQPHRPSAHPPPFTFDASRRVWRSNWNS